MATKNLKRLQVITQCPACGADQIVRFGRIEEDGAPIRLSDVNEIARRLEISQIRQLECDLHKSTIFECDNCWAKCYGREETDKLALATRLLTSVTWGFEPDDMDDEDE